MALRIKAKIMDLLTGEVTYVHGSGDSLQAFQQELQREWSAARWHVFDVEYE